jgi:putative peptide zinc metalloprotease protein
MNASASTLDRPLGLRMRPGLRWTERLDGGAIASDPVAQTHHEVTAEDRQLARWLRPESTLRELRRRWEATFAPQRIEPRELVSKLASLRHAGVLAGPDNPDALWRRYAERRGARLRGWWRRLPSLPLGSIDPEPIVRPLTRAFGWLYTQPGLALVAMLLFSAALVVLSRGDRFLAELPSLSALASPRGAALVLVVFVALKTVHELGHAVACRQLGGQPRELGLLLLMGAPCPYVDVSDAWGFPSKASRVLVSLAGVLAEAIVASIAVFVWRASGPGVTHTVALHVVLVAGAVTLLANLNPLLRYDGYYVLADATGSPNLWSRSRSELRSWLRHWFARTDDVLEPISRWRLLYAGASMAYVALLTVAIAWLAIAVARIAKLEAFGWLAAMAVVVPVALDGVSPAIRAATTPGRGPKARWGRVGIAMGLVTAIACAAAFAPWPVRVTAPGVVTLVAPQVVTVSTAGRVVQAITPGTRVEVGDTLLRLENPDIKRQLAEARADAETARLGVELIERRRAVDGAVANELPQARSLAASRQRHYEELLRESQRLVLRADRPGVVWEAPAAEVPRDADETLDGAPRWPLRPEAHGAWLATGTPVAFVATSDECQVELTIDERDAERLAAGQTARIALTHVAGAVMEARLVAIAPEADQPEADRGSPTESWGDTAARLAADTAQRRVFVRLDEAPAKGFVLGGDAKGRIDVGSASGASIALRWLRGALALP